MKFGDKLSQLRRKNGLSQEELGEKLNVTRQTVSKWELGQSKPDTDKLMEISKLLDVDFNQLADDSVTIDNNKVNNNLGVDSDDVRPRKWLLIVLIIVSIIIVIILANKIVMDKKAKKENEDNFFGIFGDVDINKSSFNSTFEFDTGTKSGFFVSTTIDDIVTSNKTNKDHLITLVFDDVNTTDPTEIKNAKSKLEEWTDYEVSADYDNDGYINKITIEKISKKDTVSQFEIMSFNSIYENLYSGTVNGFSITNLLDEVIKNNKKNADQLISVVYKNINTTNEMEIRNLKKSFDTWTNYEVILDYDSVGFVNKITIEN